MNFIDEKINNAEDFNDFENENLLFIHQVIPKKAYLFNMCSYMKKSALQLVRDSFSNSLADDKNWEALAFNIYLGHGNLATIFSEIIN